MSDTPKPPFVAPYKKPDLKAIDVVLALILVTPMLAIFVPMALFSFNWWLFPIGLLMTAQLTYHLAHEISLLRYLRNNQLWLKQCTLINREHRLFVKVVYAIETVFFLMCFAVGTGVAYGLGSAVGALMMAYTLSHALIRLAAFKQRESYTLRNFDPIVNDEPENSTRARKWPLILLGTLAILTLFTPPGLIVAGGSFAAMMLINLFILTAYTATNNQFVLKSSLSQIVRSVNRSAEIAHHRSQQLTTNPAESLQNSLFHLRFANDQQVKTKKQKIETSTIETQTEPTLITRRRMTI